MVVFIEARVVHRHLSAAEPMPIYIYTHTYRHPRCPWRHVKDEHLKDVAQDVAQDVLGAAKDGSAKVFIAACVVHRHLPATEPTP